MKRALAFAAFLFLTIGSLFAIPDYLKKSDDFDFNDQNMASFNLLMGVLPTLTTDKERAEIYWRLARDVLSDADDQKTAGASSGTLLTLYQKGEAYADQAIAADATNPKGYYWKASNIGRWGQTKGILSSLAKAGPMRALLEKSGRLNPGQGDVWFVLGQLYEQVPTVISFGNAVWAVSLGRKGLDARKAEVAAGIERDIPADYYVQLARHLVKRDWSAARRVQEHGGQAQRFNSISDVIDKNNYYEGSLELASVSDKDEARLLLRQVIGQLQGKANRSQKDNSDLKNANDTLTSIGG